MVRSLAAATILALLVLSLDRTGILAGPRQALGGFLSPLQIGWYRTSLAFQDKLSTISQIGSLSDDNFKLRQENDRLKALLAGLREVDKENQALKKQLEVVETGSLRLLAVQVIGSVPTVAGRELLLAAGGARGVKVSQVVVLGNVALGQIASVTSDRSTLRLMTDPATKVLAQTRQGAHGVLVGQFQASTKLTKVSQDETITVGDTVLTTGEGDYPPKLVLGEVTRVIKKDNELFQEAELAPLTDLDHLEEVFIVTGSK